MIFCKSYVSMVVPRGTFGFLACVSYYVLQCSFIVQVRFRNVSEISKYIYFDLESQRSFIFFGVSMEETSLEGVDVLGCFG